MHKHHETLLIAALAGLIVAGAAAFAVSPAMAEGYSVDDQAQVVGVADWDVLNMRKWPASYSKKVGALEPGVHVYVERCIVVAVGADWCLVERGEQKGWVNSRFLTIATDWDI
ncbi:MAG: hypothetical protein JWR75_2037 [Devosia sp.]|nr:hypothetical protein [Devosia sp.]